MVGTIISGQEACVASMFVWDKKREASECLMVIKTGEPPIQMWGINNKTTAHQSANSYWHWEGFGANQQQVGVTVPMTACFLLEHASSSPPHPSPAPLLGIVQC